MYKVIYSKHFKKLLKRLARKNPVLIRELDYALNHFQKEHAISLGGKFFKLRLKGWYRGKSGGYRLYIYAAEIRKIIVPIFIYTKGERKYILPSELIIHFRIIQQELYLNYGWVFN